VCLTLLFVAIMSGISFKLTKKSSKHLFKAEETSEKDKDYVVSVEGKQIQRY